MKKATAIMLAAIIVLSIGCVGVWADENNNPEDEVIYQLQDFDSDNNEVINTTQADIEEGHWNVDALGNISPEIYKDFPMQVNSDFDNFARLNMSFTYFKVVGDNESAIFEMTDRDTGDVYYTAELSTENNYIYLENVPINKVYNLTISESFDSKENTYSAVIVTSYAPAEMPTNVYIGENANPTSVSIADSISISEVAEEDTTIINEGVKTIEIENSENDITVMQPNELQEYYNSLSDNKLYCIQTNSVSDFTSDHYIGFFTKSPEYVNNQIFVPSYKFYYADTFSDVMPLASRGPFSGINGTIVKNDAKIYDYLWDAKFSLPTGDNTDYIIIKHTFKRAGRYTVETLGNLETTAEIWDASSEYATPTYTNFSRGSASNGGNFKQEYTVVSGLTMYWVILNEDYESGSSVFRITADNYSNECSNSIYDLEQNNTRTTSNVIYNEDIDYPGDVDVYYADNRTELGEFGFEVVNNSSYAIKALIQYSVGSMDSLWTVKEQTVNPYQEFCYVPNISSTSKHYFVTIRSSSVSRANDNYNMQIISPTKGDPYEPNNTIATATDLNEIAGSSGKIRDLTLHKGDIDYFKFTTDSYQKVLDIWLNEVNGIQYNMELFTYTNGTKNIIATADVDNIYIKTLSPNTTYYICINNQGLGANKYSAVLTTTLEWMIS